MHHGNGLISDWAVAVELASEIGVMGSSGRVKPLEDGHCFLACDLTGLSTVARLLEISSKGMRGKIVVGGTTSPDLREYLPQHQLELTAMPMEEFNQTVIELASEKKSRETFKFAFFVGEKQMSRVMKKIFQENSKFSECVCISNEYWKAKEATTHAFSRF